MIIQLSSESTLFDNKFRNNQNLKEDIAKGYKYLGYVLNGNLAAYLCYYEFKDECEIHYLVTDNQYLRNGYANQLLVHLLEKNNIKCFLEVNENNQPAVNLYLKNGFKIISKRKNYYPNGDALIMQKVGD